MQLTIEELKQLCAMYTNFMVACHIQAQPTKTRERDRDAEARDRGCYIDDDGNEQPWFS